MKWKLVQWNSCNLTPEFSDILWHPTKIYDPKVFLLTEIKHEYSTSCTIRHIYLVPWCVGLEMFHCTCIYYISVLNIHVLWIFDCMIITDLYKTTLLCIVYTELLVVYLSFIIVTEISTYCNINCVCKESIYFLVKNVLQSYLFCCLYWTNISVLFYANQRPVIQLGTILRTFAYLFLKLSWRTF